MTNTIGDPERVALQRRVVELTVEHRDLDAVIHRLAADPTHDQLQLVRLKRRKLLLKDQIARLEREIDPDVLA
jgi:hypothetical protein